VVRARPLPLGGRPVDPAPAALIADRDGLS
jgi:hypothetical protein